MEELAGEEVRARGARVGHTLPRVDERTGGFLFSYGGDPSDLLHLRTTEDVFALAADTRGIPRSRTGLGAVRSVCAGAPGVDGAVNTALAVRPRRRGKVTFRVVARKSGEHAFRRVDLQRAVEGGVLGRFPQWRPVEEEARLEVWVQLTGDRLLLALRLSDASMRQRTWRVASIPAALKPTVAYGLVLLSRPRPDDVFLDPMCGSGTILIERAHWGRYRLLLGGDADGRALEAARANVGPRYKPIELSRWDARALPLEDRSVSAIVTNLPFGRQIGTPAEMRTLYPALMREWVRVLQAGGRMVLLTSEAQLLRRTIQRQEGLSVRRELRLLIRGQQGTAFVVHPVDEP